MKFDTGEKIKTFRNLNGFSQKELAEKIGVKQQTIAGYEKNTIKPPLEKIEALGNALGVPPVLLLFDEIEGDSFDTVQHVSKLITQLELLKLLLYSAIEENESYILINRNDNTYGLTFDDIDDILNQCRQLYDFLVSQKMTDALPLITGKETPKE